MKIAAENCQLWERRSRSNAVAIDQLPHGDLDTKIGDAYCSLPPARPFWLVYRQALTCLRSCPKNGDLRSLRFLLGAISHRIVDIRAACGPGALAIGPINRSIQKERRVQVLVRDNNVDQALKVLKKKMQREGVFREMKLRGHYEKPSERRVREKAEAIRRARKLARKKLQREGLLPMKPRVVPGAPGRGGPARTPRF